MNKKIFFILPVIILPLLVSGCSINFSSGGKSANNIGGVFKSTNRGDTWAQKVLVPSVSGSPKSIGSLDTSSFSLDPSDNKAIYFGSLENGLMYSYDSAGEWHVADTLEKITINDVAINPGDKCTIYAASTNKLFVSNDCNRTWKSIYFDTDLTITINTVVVDYYKTNNVYIGLSRGDIIKSEDYGNSWKTVGRFGDSVNKIIISPHDSRIIFAATKKKGIQRSLNGGTSWEDLSERLKEFDKSLSFRDLAMTKAEKGTVFLASVYGLVKSKDNGNTWNKIDLITPEKKATINSIAVSPKDSKEIYYTTNTTFYRSLDGGQNWKPTKLPTDRAGYRILIDPDNTNILYLAVKEIKQ